MTSQGGLGINKVLTEHIKDGEVSTADIGANQVTAAKVAADVATQAELDAIPASYVPSASALYGASATAFGSDSGPWMYTHDGDATWQASSHTVDIDLTGQAFMWWEGTVITDNWEGRCRLTNGTVGTTDYVNSPANGGSGGTGTETKGPLDVVGHDGEFTFTLEFYHSQGGDEITAQDFSYYPPRSEG